MDIQINNQADIANKFLRLFKWRLFKIKRKFDQLLYAEIYISKEGTSPAVYSSVIKLGVKGHDIVLKNKSEDLPVLWKSSYNDIVRYLRKNKERK